MFERTDILTDVLIFWLMLLVQLSLTDYPQPPLHPVALIWYVLIFLQIGLDSLYVYRYLYLFRSQCSSHTFMEIWPWQRGEGNIINIHPIIIYTMILCQQLSCFLYKPSPWVWVWHNTSLSRWGIQILDHIIMIISYNNILIYDKGIIKVWVFQLIRYFI